MAEIVVFPRPVAARIANIIEAAKPLSVVFPETSDDAIKHIEFARAFVGKLTPELLAQAKNLDWVQSPTASLEHYVFPSLTEHSCVLTNVAGIFGDVIAQHVLGFLLSFTRNLHLYRDRQNDRRYEPVGAAELPPDFVGGPQLVTEVDKSHKRLCELHCLIVGMGGIGQEIARVLNAFDVTSDGCDPRTTVQHRGRIGQLIEPASLPDAINSYDAVIIAAPHTPETERLFSAPLLARMKPGSLLINVGRGAIVDTGALANAIESGHLGGAALDVFDTEPLPPDFRLWAMPNVLITPHVAACCDVIAERQGEVIIENIRRFAKGQPLRNVVNKRMWC